MVYPALDLWQYGSSKLEPQLKNFSRAAQLSGGIRPFLREPSRRNTKLTELRCSSCCTFLAASGRPELLDFIEKVHICKSLDGSIRRPSTLAH